jgi:cytosine/adenosine deaminase-related metal-dependent hydrolase
MTQMQTARPSRYVLLTGQIITVNPKTGLLVQPFLKDHVIVVSVATGRIICVRPSVPDDFVTQDVNQDEHTTRTIDLREKTVLPGFIDTHVHCELCQL